LQGASGLQHVEADLRSDQRRPVEAAIGDQILSSEAPSNGGKPGEARNRPRLKTYSDGSTPTVTFSYDSDIAIAGHAETNYYHGKLVQTENSHSTNTYRYDAAGRVQSSDQNMGENLDFPFGYSYNALGLKSVTYPTGKLIGYGYDSGGRLNSVTVTVNGTATTYASGVTYAPHGGTTGISFGNGLVESKVYDSRLRTTQIQAGSLLTLGYSYSAGSNVIGQSAYDSSVTRSQSFTYDSLNRLCTAAEAATSGSSGWAQSYIYDNRGNRALLASSNDPSTGKELPLDVVTTGSSCSGTVPFDGNNRWTASGATQPYDSSGNLTNAVAAGVGSFQANYDGENQQVSATVTIAGGSGSTTTVAYSYDGEGRRVQKSISGGATTIYVYDASGGLAAEYSTGALDTSGTTYLTADALGSTRLVSAGSQGTPSASSRSDYLPFGQEIPTTWNGRTDDQPDPSQTIKFTGKERDAETGLDFFEARYMSSAQGRFMSPDWSAKIEPVPYAKLDNPQSLNLYSYVGNNPLRNIDADGHACSGALGNTGSGFCTRATEYGKIDANTAVRSQTRFFAAANAVSQALADVDARGSSLIGGISRNTASFLEGVGQNLEKLNQREANAIQNGSLSGSDLDQQLVHNEQGAVQSQLDGLQQSNPGAYQTTISEINGALNPGAVGQFASTRFSTDAAYPVFWMVFAKTSAATSTSLSRVIARPSGTHSSTTSDRLVDAM
jgi:RHS repeat-associated protein